MSGRFDNDDYQDDDNLAYGRWQACVKAVLRGKPAQAGFKALVAALEALPEPKLGYGALCTQDGLLCAVGAMAYHKRVATGADPEAVREELWRASEDTAYDGYGTAAYAQEHLGITATLGWLIGERNDLSYHEFPEVRYQDMLRWAKAHIRQEEPAL